VRGEDNRGVEWWRWVLAGSAAALLLALLAMRFDTLKDERNLRPAVALRTLAPWAVLVPVVFVVALVSPWWIGAILLAVPALVLLAMEAAS
jgi:hypothetical protein